MDPVSQVIVRDIIQQHGMEVIGWYHNHPAFQPDPSVTDIENQSNYQQLVLGGIEQVSVPFPSPATAAAAGHRPAPPPDGQRDARGRKKKDKNEEKVSSS